MCSDAGALQHLTHHITSSALTLADVTDAAGQAADAVAKPGAGPFDFLAVAFERLLEVCPKPA